MKRLMITLAVVSITVASLVWAQTATQVTLRTAAGDRAVAALKQGDQELLALDDVVTALGGTVTKERDGFKMRLGTAEAALGSDTRFAVVREDLIEMPVAPVVVDQRAYVAWQFFDRFLRRNANQEAAFDAATNTLTIRPVEATAVSVKASVVDLAEMSKVVLEFSDRVEYSISRDPLVYTIHCSAPIRTATAEQQFESALVAKVGFSGRDVAISVKADNVVGDPYTLETPFRIVLDLKKGVAPIQPTLPSGSLKNEGPHGIRTIVIDPGHGGKDVGATGPTGLLEKDATLEICRKLASNLERTLGARVILTRSEDASISLDQRTAIANQYKADLFLSVHLNAAVVRGARGSETYFLSVEASDELAKRAAERENSGTAPVAAPQNDLDLILWDLAQQDYMKESSRLAELVQLEMNRVTNVQSRGVKQAPFKVLVGATMPAALVEVGFISNPEEEAKIKDAAYQGTVVEAIAHAVAQYKNEYEVRLGIAQPAPAAPPAAAPAPAAAAKPAAPAAATNTKAGGQ